MAKTNALAEAGAEIAVGDLAVPSTLDAALAGVTTVILVSPAIPAQELNVAAAAARVGVKHIIKATSKASADSPIARRRGQAEIEAGIIATGLNYTFLRSNAYMQNTLMLATAIAKISSFGSAAGAGRIGMVDARDVGAVAAPATMTWARSRLSLSAMTCLPSATICIVIDFRSQRRQFRLTQSIEAVNHAKGPGGWAQGPRTRKARLTD